MAVGDLVRYPGTTGEWIIRAEGPGGTAAIRAGTPGGSRGSTTLSAGTNYERIAPAGSPRAADAAEAAAAAVSPDRVQGLMGAALAANRGRNVDLARAAARPRQQGVEDALVRADVRAASDARYQASRAASPAAGAGTGNS